jgi:hypothetical protein
MPLLKAPKDRWLVTSVLAAACMRRFPAVRGHAVDRAIAAAGDLLQGVECQSPSGRCWSIA